MFTGNRFGLLTTAFVVALGIGTSARASEALDLLFIGDGISNSVAAMDAPSGEFIGEFVPNTDGTNYQILGPRGMIFVGDSFLLVDQNTNALFNGEILEFDATTGCFKNKLVASGDSHSPHAPRGIVTGPDGSFYVADQGGLDGQTFGAVKHYARNGSLIGNLDTTGFADPFYPSALVFHSNVLYVSACEPDPASGYVLRFTYDNATHDWRFHDILAQSTHSTDPHYEPALHRPEGLACAPDGLLYVTSIAMQDATGAPLENDQILVFTENGEKVGHIDLDQTQRPRVFAQAILFGPAGDLFVPVQMADGTGAGVRRYTRASSYSQFTLLPNQPTDIRMPWYLTFRHTNPSTLAYEAPDR